MLLRQSIISAILTTFALLSATSTKYIILPNLKRQPKTDNKQQQSQEKRDKTNGPVRQNDKGKTINIKTDLVTLDLQVIDHKNQPVFDLFEKGDFTVFEDDVRQEIASISREEAPVSMCLVVDTSGSTLTSLLCSLYCAAFHEGSGSHRQ